MKNFATRLKELRTSRNITQSELAEHLSVDQRTISNWECGTNEPSFHALIQISKHFDETTDYLLGLID